MGLQLIKRLSGRKRFVKMGPIGASALCDWLSHLATLKQVLTHHTRLQLVGQKVFWEVNSHTLDIALMLEVIGVPFVPFQSHEFTFSLQDINQGVILVHHLPFGSLFEQDFPSLLSQARSIHQLLMKNRSQISSIFHIVFDNDKIELHFFDQKDYIQNLL